jgi:hypothetical protein
MSLFTGRLSIFRNMLLTAPPNPIKAIYIKKFILLINKGAGD